MFVYVQRASLGWCSTSGNHAPCTFSVHALVGVLLQRTTRRVRSACMPWLVFYFREPRAVYVQRASLGWCSTSGNHAPCTFSVQALAGVLHQGTTRRVRSACKPWLVFYLREPRAVYVQRASLGWCSTSENHAPCTFSVQALAGVLLERTTRQAQRTRVHLLAA